MPAAVDWNTVRVLAWSALVLASWVGLGAGVLRWASGRRNTGLGLPAGLGVACVALIGGPLNALRLCSPAAMVLLTLIGCVPAVPVLLHAWRRLRRRAVLRSLLPAVPFVGVCVVVLAGSATLDARLPNATDDPVFYWLLPQRMLQTGAAIDPMCGRRPSTFGGYAFLQSQVLAVGDERHVNVLDDGLATVVLVGMLAGIARRYGAGWFGTYLLVGIVTLYPMPRVNAMTVVAMTVIVLTLLRVTRLADARPRRRLRLLAVAAGTAVAAATFRDNVLALPPAFFGLYFAVRLVTRPDLRRQTWREAALVLGVGVLALAPWSAALYQASHTPLFPLIPGTTTPETSYGGGKPLAERVRFARDVVVRPAFLFAYLPALWLLARRDRIALFGWTAAVAMSVATAVAFSDAQGAWMERFCLPVLLAPAFLGLARAVCLPGRVHVWWLLRTGALAAAAYWLWPGLSPLERAGQVGHAAKVAIGPDNVFFTQRARDDFRALQASIPRGARVLSILNFPVLLDLSRQRIECVDFPGVATHQGLWPRRQGSRELKNFLAAQGFEYVAFGDFQSSGVYSFQGWRGAAMDGHVLALRIIGMMFSLNEMASQQTPVFQRDGLTVLKLQ